jgi:pimeloyl-ACP methyl ester carboxylesterase
VVDLRGYGLSDRGPALAVPPGDNPPQTRTETAVADLGAVLDWMAGTVSPEPPVLIGWSWGTTLCASLAARGDGRVAALVLVGPQWTREAVPPALAGAGPLGAYRRVTAEAALTRKLQGVPDAHRDALSPPHWLAAWTEALLASDPEATAHDPPAFRAPNGTLADTLEIWCRGRVPYDPAAIRCPVQIVVGEWDAETPPAMARGLFSALTASPDKRLTEIGRATHAIVIERARTALFATADAFLEDCGAGPVGPV